MNDKEQIIASVGLINNHFGLDSGSELSNIETYQELLSRLSQLIGYYLNKDMSGLLNAFYRMDISEEKFKDILSHAEPKQISTELAKLVISREIQKVITREKYKE